MRSGPNMASWYHHWEIRATHLSIILLYLEPRSESAERTIVKQNITNNSVDATVPEAVPSRLHPTQIWKTLERYQALLDRTELLELALHVLYLAGWLYNFK